MITSLYLLIVSAKIFKLIFGEHVLDVVECRWKSFNWRGYSYGMVRYEHDRNGWDYFYTIFLLFYIAYSFTDMVKHLLDVMFHNDYSDGVTVRWGIDICTTILGVIIIIIELPGCTMYSDEWTLWWIGAVFYSSIDMLHCYWSVKETKGSIQRAWKDNIVYKRLVDNDGDEERVIA
ncbi:unnamed protein product [Bursaphelenchus okinawaensis]|uniref:Uncharacterized protein n=1 Tax=Bursaphelenchus okinawaensis TaxID=465554 RepID=A0A811LQL6_9BILA|nr:unnamed protein product [Bursaphelenchus okinawaensis]CAG9127349.1 unnamed protein product [Bursaphelenchus okinawaensis]